MKKIFGVFIVTATALLVSAFNHTGNSENFGNYDSISELDIPDNIQGILDNSCWGCHNSESNNTKAKMKLKFDKLNGLKVSKQVSKLNKIVKELNKGDMPPEKSVAKYPDMALTPEAKAELIEWAKATSEELMK